MLSQASLFTRISAKKPALTDSLKEQRKEFALEYAEKDEDFWQKVVFCDEKIFSFYNRGMLHIWRKNNIRHSVENNSEWRRSGCINVSMWGWFSASCLGELVEVENHLSGDQYVEILEEEMLPSVRAMLIPEPLPFYLVQDSSPDLTSSSVVKQWFDKHPEITLINWPSKSPDLNPIENLWAIMVKQWEGDQVTSRENLGVLAKSNWESLRSYPDIFQRLAASMPWRLNETIGAGGDHF